MPLEYEKQTLDNGLDVIVHVDRACPIIAVNLWYHVGSKNEQPGRTGFAHLFEHLMFEGSKHHDRGYFHPLQEAGGALNGSTNADRTNYWEVVPSSAIDRALWMESDRMGFLLPALTKEKFENQRRVVLNERRQSYENRPYGMVPMALMPALFPEGHPYHWMTIGEPADLRAATLDDVRQFFSTYYHPGNASLALAGDIDSGEAFDLARRYFGEIPPGPTPPPVVVSDRLVEAAPCRLLLEDQVALPRLYLSWKTPGLFAPGDAELDMLATILASGKSSRLYRELVHDRRLATDVSVGQGSRELAGTFSIVATAAPGQSLADIETVVNEQLERLVTDGPVDDELERAQTTVETDFVYRLQTVGGFGGRSDQLNAYNVYVADPGYFDADLARYVDTEPAAVASVGRVHLTEQTRIALSVVPVGDGASAALPDSEPVTVA
jgi:zinc protease